MAPTESITSFLSPHHPSNPLPNPGSRSRLSPFLLTIATSAKTSRKVSQFDEVQSTPVPWLRCLAAWSCTDWPQISPLRVICLCCWPQTDPSHSCDLRYTETEERGEMDVGCAGWSGLQGRGGLMAYIPVCVCLWQVSVTKLVCFWIFYSDNVCDTSLSAASFPTKISEMEDEREMERERVC